MLIRTLTGLPEFTAGDGTRLKEILNPQKDPFKLRYSLAHAILPAGHWSRLHLLRSSEVYYILQGTGQMEIDGEQSTVQPGDTVYIPPYAKQRIKSLGPGDLEFLCIVDPAWHPQDESVLEEK